MNSLNEIILYFDYTKIVVNIFTSLIGMKKDKFWFWGSTSDLSFVRLKNLQKIALRLISGKNIFYTHHEPLCKSLRLLKLEDIYKFRLFKLRISIENKNFPNPIKSMFQRISEQHKRSHRFNQNFNIPNYKLNSSLNHISATGPRFWNSLSPPFSNNCILSSKNISSKFKNFLIDSYSTDCPNYRINCFSCNN